MPENTTQPATSPSITRRQLVTGAAVLAAGSAVLGAPAIVKAEAKFNWRMTTTWPSGMPFFQAGPGSATDFAKRVEEMSGGRISIRVYSAGELVPAFEGFDAASSGRQV